MDTLVRETHRPGPLPVHCKSAAMEDQQTRKLVRKLQQATEITARRPVKEPSILTVDPNNNALLSKTDRSEQQVRQTAAETKHPNINNNVLMSIKQTESATKNHKTIY